MKKIFKFKNQFLLLILVLVFSSCLTNVDEEIEIEPEYLEEYLSILKEEAESSISILQGYQS